MPARVEVDRGISGGHTSAAAVLADRQAMVRLQAEHGGFKTIAKTLGVSPNTVARALRRHRIPMLGAETPTSAISAEQLRDALDGRTIAAAGSMLGVGASSIRRAMKRHGIERDPIKVTPNVIPVGIIEIADRLGVERQTVDKWRTRDLLPPPRWTVGGRPAWAWADIKAWARETGRQ